LLLLLLLLQTLWVGSVLGGGTTRRLERAMNVGRVG